MPRQSRIDAPGALHHIIARGIARGKIFNDNQDRTQFLDRLASLLRETKTTCYGWALMPNHFHLLLRTGSVSISTVMRRLLTGYAVKYNRRHRRWGHLFQNRYKSILCQEETYLLELVRYIHLNPLRAKIISDPKQLDSYAYTGHSVLMGKKQNDWQDTKTILQRFGKRLSTARENYRKFIIEGIDLGRRPELVGGGLIRSMGGWSNVKALRKSKAYLKGDERILGDSHFVAHVLTSADETLERRYELKAKGFDLDRIAQRVAELLRVDVGEVWATGKYRKTVHARSLLCYWAVRELGASMTSLSRLLNISPTSVSKSVSRGERLAQENGYSLIDN